MHVDLDSFYAQCEENANPSLKGKPVVVCVYSGRTEDSGVVSTANYEARKYGVKAGIPIVRAKKLLESIDAAFVPMNHPYYEQVSQSIMEILRTKSDAFEQTSIDEAFLDVSGQTDYNFDSARDVALEIKKQLLAQENLTCSIGIGPNKVVAKIASDQSKPNGLTVTKPEEVADFLSPLPVSRIPGVGKKAEEKLGNFNVATISQLSNLSASTLIGIFGKSLGGYFYRASRGEDDDPVKEREQPTQFSRIATLKQNTRRVEDTFPLLTELAQCVSDKLKERGMQCRSVSIIALLTDLSIHSKSKMLESPSSDGKLIETAAKQLTQEFLQLNPEAILRRLGLKASNLTKTSGQTDMSNFLTAQ
jgi:DNA polymerase IV (archaeal DinB-like DNA polymerase)